MTASEIKGENTFVIRKMMMKHTCETNTNTTRISTIWLAPKYESLFKSDQTTTIQIVPDSVGKHFCVEVPKIMSYMSIGIAIDVFLGDHQQ
jgi:hypothetical protein